MLVAVWLDRAMGTCPAHGRFSHTSSFRPFGALPSSFFGWGISLLAPLVPSFITPHSSSSHTSMSSVPFQMPP